MTRAEIKLLARQLIQETLGAATDGDIFALDAFLTVVTDEIASRADLYYTTAAVSLVANTNSYTLPGLHHVTAATVVNGSNVRILTTIDPARMDRLYAGGWRNAVAADISSTTAAPAAYAVLQGTTSVRLWPTPSTDYTGTLTLGLEGFGAPGGSWSADSQACPLPVWTHKAVAYSLAVERCVQCADGTSDRRVQRLNARAELLLQDVLAQAGRFVQGAGKSKTTAPDGTRQAPSIGAGAMAVATPGMATGPAAMAAPGEAQG